MSLPRALDPMVGFAQALRGAGFAVSPDQSVDFIAAVGVLGPRDITDVWRAGRAMFAVPPERLADYDALFRAVFLGQAVALPGEDDEDDSVEAYEPTGGTQDVGATDDASDIGAEPSGGERLGARTVRTSDDAALVRLAREAAGKLPRRVSYRRRRAKRGSALDMRRILRDAARRDGDAAHLFQTRRKTRQRPLVLLIDVSGSMKERSGPALRLAHGLVQAADRVEVFTLGTRLTRITPALGPADGDRALGRAAALVADFDGGTRIGEALTALLNVPRFAARLRGAAVVMLSDGLETGAPDAMVDAVARAARLAWRFDMLSPLAADPAYRPETAAVKAVLPHLDRLGDGASLAAITEHILTLAHDPRRPAP